ncbi:MAG TPA: nicotinate-nucleotide adenylyltransferase [Gammaproteobacteria bacterium]|nr:nicotinate-nucleotide adenylyltransferase [Gammaproteobacteria bacterium]
MLGILGGTFDPVHFGHLRPALDVLQALELDEVRVMPCRTPPHRESPRASPEQRRTMLELALADEPGLVLDRRELEREGPSFMVDTFQSLRHELGGEIPLALILGMDAFLGLPKWHRWEALAGLCHFVVTHRPGWSPPGSGEMARWSRARTVSSGTALRATPAGKVFYSEVTQLDISASHIRALLAAGLSPRYLLPDAVLAYIRDTGLYDTGAR